MPGLLRGVARTAVIAGTATAVSNNVSRRQAGRWAAENPQPEQAPQATVDAAVDPTEEIKKYASLKDQGILTQDEFDAKKKELLGL